MATPPILTHSILRSYTNSSGVAVSQLETPIGNAQIRLVDITLPALASNHNYQIGFTRAALVACLVYASAPVTLYTNSPSGSSPQDTISLTAGQTLCWTLATDGLSHCPFSGDVSSFYVTNPNSSAVTFAFSALLLLVGGSSGLSWATLTNAQWTAMTNAQWTSLTN
jgi:hypothetical protein